MLKMSKNTKNITIFEGPDGSGKTTTAKEYARRTGALYVHFEAYYGVKDIYRFFIEASLPALLGYQDVVMDRCWHSGPIYDKVFRQLPTSEQRQPPEICLLLDRAVAHCDAVVVKCYPDEETCINNWKSRLESELVKSENEMREIHRMYGSLEDTVALPVVSWNYTDASKTINDLIGSVESERTVYSYSNVVHVIVSPQEKTNADMMIDIPGVSFNKESDEYKLAKIFGFTNAEYDGVTCEEIVKFLPIDTDLQEYFNTTNHGGHTQRLVAIGESAVDVVSRFDSAYREGRTSGVVNDLKFAYMKDTSYGHILCQIPLIIRSLYISVASCERIIYDNDGGDHRSGHAPDKEEVEYILNIAVKKSGTQTDIRAHTNISMVADGGLNKVLETLAEVLK